MNWARGLFRLWVVVSIIWVPLVSWVVASWNLSPSPGEEYKDGTLLESLISTGMDSWKVRNRIPDVCGYNYSKIIDHSNPEPDTGPVECRDFFEELLREKIKEPIEAEEDSKALENTENADIKLLSPRNERWLLNRGYDEYCFHLIRNKYNGRITSQILESVLKTRGEIDLVSLLNEELIDKRGNLNWVGDSEKGRAFLAFMKQGIIKKRYDYYVMWISAILLFVVAPPIAVLILGSLLIWALLGFSPRDSKSLASETPKAR